ncbi:unnamed protein product [Pleuronectes platessa]|uniref:Uncharacterized protein n=1 Tax=Pleuronectes platessa TaxID=8262 RepID=A0A9N7UF43_PLEPL|nr:unnamed protein product [Pleuronectes platessa]
MEFDESLQTGQHSERQLEQLQHFQAGPNRSHANAATRDFQQPPSPQLLNINEEISPKSTMLADSGSMNTHVHRGSLERRFFQKTDSENHSGKRPGMNRLSHYTGDNIQRQTTFPYSHSLKSPIHLTPIGMSLDCGRKPEFPKKTHTDIGRNMSDTTQEPARCVETV